MFDPTKHAHHIWGAISGWRHQAAFIELTKWHNMAKKEAS
jgi:hypothetical protein